jgi:acetylglutamate kinase
MAKPVLKIIKIGGNIIDSDIELNSFLKDYVDLSGPKLLVHGGGKRATDISSKMGLEAKMIGGRRVTDLATLEVVTMVYAGLLNKKITAILQKNECNAVGLSGVDSNCILAHKRIIKDIDYGFAGDIDEVNTASINIFLQNEMTPVFCAITHDKKGQLLNTNADTIASEIAIAMSSLYEVELNYIFELPGVLENFDNRESVISQVNEEKYQQLIEENMISEGMIPKLHNCFNALKRGVQKVNIGDASLIKSSNNLCTTLSLK